MKDYVCACSASFIEQQPILGDSINTIFCLSNILVTIDINHAEELCDGPDLTIATLPKSGKIVFLQVTHVNIMIFKSSHFFIIMYIHDHKYEFIICCKPSWNYSILIVVLMVVCVINLM